MLTVQRRHAGSHVKPGEISRLGRNTQGVTPDPPGRQGTGHRHGPRSRLRRRRRNRDRKKTRKNLVNHRKHRIHRENDKSFRCIQCIRCLRWFQGICRSGRRPRRSMSRHPPDTFTNRHGGMCWGPRRDFGDERRNYSTNHSKRSSKTPSSVDKTVTSTVTTATGRVGSSVVRQSRA